MKSRLIRNYYFINIFGIMTLFLTCAMLFFGLPRRLFCRWYTIEETYLDIPSITAETEVEVYPTGTSMIKVTVQNMSDVEYGYGDGFSHIEVLKEGQWMYWAEEPLGRGASTLMAYGLSSGATETYELNLGDWLPAPFEPGDYRVWLGYYQDERVGQVCAYFAIQ